MIRKATQSDILEIANTYEELLVYEQQHGNNSYWELDVYPTIKVPEDKVPKGEMYVLEEAGKICASMVLNNDQAEEYAPIDWIYPAKDSEVLVIHTLCIPPSKARHGYGTQMVDFAKQFGRKTGCTVIRIDTNFYNEPAKTLYQKNGFRIAGDGPALLQGLIETKLVYLEYKLLMS